MWCEMGSCISWHADPAALGEADARVRAIKAGWRIDALGRLACPRCQQSDAGFWATHSVVAWDRYTAIARAAGAPGHNTAAAPDAAMTLAPPSGGAPTSSRRTLHGTGRHRRSRGHAVAAVRSWRTIRRGRSGRGLPFPHGLEGQPRLSYERGGGFSTVSQ